MDENMMQKQAEMDDLRGMLDRVANQKTDDIAKGKEELNDIKKYPNLTFNIEENGQKVEVTKNIYEVITTKDGEKWHEFYDDQGSKLLYMTDKEYQNIKSLNDLDDLSMDKGALIDGVINNEPDKSLLDMESEQTQEIADALGMDKETIETLDIVTTNGKEKNQSLDQKAKEAQEKLKQYAALGIEIDTRELATSDDTIKEALQVDADKLIVIRVNGDWKALEVGEDGSMHIAKNLQIVDNNQPFNTIGDDGRPERRIPEIEFRRKDNPDISLAVDSNNRENKTQLYIVAGNSRSAAEIETQYATSPYADAKNNELVQKAQENPNDERIVEDVDPHEPDFGERTNNNY